MPTTQEFDFSCFPLKYTSTGGLLIDCLDNTFAQRLSMVLGVGTVNGTIFIIPAENCRAGHQRIDDIDAPLIIGIGSNAEDLEGTTIGFFVNSVFRTVRRHQTAQLRVLFDRREGSQIRSDSVPLGAALPAREGSPGSSDQTQGLQPPKPLGAVTGQIQFRSTDS
ncbi:MAG: hypothetical protein UZ21_OP11001000863 [Microgenomates bacterium OLB22]|nr:MAG: hypothetical protein UZ21_OP11001000863 [Microgenomates bacterium OLB22]